MSLQVPGNDSRTGCRVCRAPPVATACGRSCLELQAFTLATVKHSVTRSRQQMEMAACSARSCNLADDAWHRLGRLRQQINILAEIRPHLAKPAGAWRSHAAALGESQRDDALLLAGCGKRSPFPAEFRSQLRAIAQGMLIQTRRNQS